MDVSGDLWGTHAVFVFCFVSLPGRAGNTAPSGTGAGALALGSTVINRPIHVRGDYTLFHNITGCWAQCDRSS